MVDYRLRLRVLCEDFALARSPRTLMEMYALWKDGLRYTRWAGVIDQLRYDPVRRQRWTVLETIYTLERVMVEYAGDVSLAEATFILKNEGSPTHPDFRVWHSIGPLYVYAHDDLIDHRDWNLADASNQIIWQARYLNILPSRGFLQAPPASDIGMHMIDGRDAGDEENEAEEEEEEEEDPEEDPEWPVDEVPRTPTPPIASPEPQNLLPEPVVWDFNRDLDIPDSGRVEPEVDPLLWRNVYLEDERPQEMDVVVPEPIVHEPLARTEEEEEVRVETQERMNGIEDEARRELEVEVNDRNTTTFGTEEAMRDPEDAPRVSEEDAGEEEEPEPLVRPIRRRRLTVRAYLRQFVRRDGSGPSNPRRLPSPTPDDSE